VSGPLSGLRVVELGGIGPGPHAGMVLADLGADVVRVERPGAYNYPMPPGQADPMLRGRRSVVFDLKDAAERDTVLDLIAVADVLLECFRPGVAERLGLGPDACLERNPKLVYCRITGWGQDGPFAHVVGHDINYISLTGALHAIGRAGARPVPPLNLIGDYGGGSMLALIGILAALFERQRSGQGQVVDAAMIDGAMLLVEAMWSLTGVGVWQDAREANMLDGGAPFYDTYECGDGRYVAVGALEPPFFAALVGGLGLTVPADLDYTERSTWPALREQFTAVFRTRGRDEWVKRFEGTDACVTPVLSFAEVPDHPHVRARGLLIDVGGIRQPAPAPRFSRSVPGLPAPAPEPGIDTAQVLRDWLGASS
jgi:alpha-methylacyl-CoA racemase